MPTPQQPRKPGSKPAAKSAKKPPAKPGDGLMGWLGRQVGHVKKAVKTDVTKPSAPKPAQPTPPAPNPEPQQTVVIYRDDKVEEIDHPTQPGVKLRRTVIDEVILDETSEKPKA